jgi:hypothetical protein
MDLAEKLGGIILARLGTTPEAAREWVSGVVGWIKETRDQVVGARTGFTEAVAHFDDRLDAVEARLESIAGALKVERSGLAERIALNLSNINPTDYETLLPVVKRVLNGHDDHA